VSGLPAFRRLSAREQLELARDANGLLPFLLAKGLSAEDAVALAHNAAVLYKAMEPRATSPREILERLSLGEIAEYCELYKQVERGEIEYGEAST
jgi:hypothetical protein